MIIVTDFIRKKLENDLYIHRKTGLQPISNYDYHLIPSAISSFMHHYNNCGHTWDLKWQKK